MFWWGYPPHPNRGIFGGILGHYGLTAPNKLSRKEDGWGGRIPCLSIPFFGFTRVPSKLGHFLGHFSGSVTGALRHPSHTGAAGASSVCGKLAPSQGSSRKPLITEQRDTSPPPLSPLITIASGSWVRTSEIRSGFLTETVSLDVLEQDLHEFVVISH